MMGRGVGLGVEIPILLAAEELGERGWDRHLRALVRAARLQEEDPVSRRETLGENAARRPGSDDYVVVHGLER